jgi:hypothetical protein
MGRRLTEGAFTVRAEGRRLTVAAGAPDSAQLVEGDESALQRLVEQFAFPSLDPAP